MSPRRRATPPHPATGPTDRRRLCGCATTRRGTASSRSRATPLPPWAEDLTEAERRIEHRVEQALYGTLFLIPLTGLGLVLLSGEQWGLGPGEWEAPWQLADDDVLLAAHVTTHVVFFVTLAIHVGQVLKHQVVDRDRLLNRML